MSFKYTDEKRNKAKELLKQGKVHSETELFLKVFDAPFRPAGNPKHAAFQLLQHVKTLGYKLERDIGDNSLTKPAFIKKHGESPLTRKEEVESPKEKSDFKKSESPSKSGKSKKVASPSKDKEISKRKRSPSPTPKDPNQQANEELVSLLTRSNVAVRETLLKKPGMDALKSLASFCKLNLRGKNKDKHITALMEYFAKSSKDSAVEEKKEKKKKKTPKKVKKQKTETSSGSESGQDEMPINSPAPIDVDTSDEEICSVPLSEADIDCSVFSSAFCEPIEDCSESKKEQEDGESSEEEEEDDKAREENDKTHKEHGEVFYF